MVEGLRFRVFGSGYIEETSPRTSSSSMKYAWAYAYMPMPIPLPMPPSFIAPPPQKKHLADAALEVAIAGSDDVASGLLASVV
jgi:hypothetical protein